MPSGGKRIDIGPEENWHIGEERYWDFPVVDENDAPVDLTGYELEWVVRRHPYDTTVVWKLSTPTEIEKLTEDTVESIARVKVDEDSYAEDFLPGIYWHALWRLDANMRSQFAYGQVHILETVAR